MAKHVKASAKAEHIKKGSKKEHKGSKKMQVKK
jgi:hypothetical protein